MDTIKILFLIAIAGHLLCGYCDCLLIYIPGGKKFDYKKMSDNKRCLKHSQECRLRTRGFL